MIVALWTFPQDLTDTIASGDFPEWTLAIQTMELEDENSFEFDPLDATKVGWDWDVMCSAW